MDTHIWISATFMLVQLRVPPKMDGCGGAEGLGEEKNAVLLLHCHLPSSTMGAYVAVLTDPGLTHGNTDGVICDHII